ncbi:hypothetical protein GCM10011316_19630 [Roseibium aquae]|uniref:GrpB protein n=1 Tax=Roseibium aquae TaxID=1323746 RepID=A0A916TLN8_9HYPH|nr:GrpB family protein [Roseibium aquae]GGB47552.1 hypothetical protein GCM10011316_19630 [Roseibium aquae]
MAIHLVEHDQAWANDFSAIAAALNGRLGARVLRYDHVGSTAVAGLAAKPKIHVDATLRSASDLAEAVCLIVREGYDDLGFLYSTDECQLTFAANRIGAHTARFGPFRVGHRLCLCFPGSPGARNRLRFRDQLRARKDLRAAYETLKRQSAQLHSANGDWTGYSRSKTAFIETVLTG